MFSTISAKGARAQCQRAIDKKDLGHATHTLVALSLLSKLGQVDSIFVTHFGGV